MESGFTSEWLRTAFLMGAVQGVFLAAILAGRRKMLPDRLLGAAMLVFSMDLAAAVYHAAGYDRLYPQFIGLDFPISLLYGPLFYLYAQTLLERRPSLTWADSPHFVPFVLLLLFLLLLLLEFFDQLADNVAIVLRVFVICIRLQGGVVMLESVLQLLDLRFLLLLREAALNERIP